MKLNVSRRDCPDCRSRLVPIKLIVGLGTQGHSASLKYAAPDAKQSRWTGLYPTEGEIGAVMCPQCGRVLLYAEVPKDRLPLPSSAPEGETGPLPLPSDSGALPEYGLRLARSR